VRFVLTQALSPVTRPLLRYATKALIAEASTRGGCAETGREAGDNWA